MIYDAFLFFNEIDLLDIRLNLLKDVVDKFVIVESTITFSGNKKPLYFKENIDKFKHFSDRIIHIIIDDTPDDFSNISYIDVENDEDIFKNNILRYLSDSTGWSRNEKQWGREVYQRECIRMGFINCSDEDMIIISDVDEIPNPDEILNKCNDVFEFKQMMFYYNLNTLKELNWSGPKMAPWGILKDNSLNLLRQNKLTNLVVENGGWHLSFMGGEKRIVDKIEAYSHQEFNNDVVKNNISNSIKNKTDLFCRSENNDFKEVNINEVYPTELIKIVRKKYSYLINEIS
jgi:beta-1,4-mannosyl-glycoprotein beta-1,4-N-acetylglucosaminyltransferase